MRTYIPNSLKHNNYFNLDLFYKSITQNKAKANASTKLDDWNESQRAESWRHVTMSSNKYSPRRLIMKYVMPVLMLLFSLNELYSAAQVDFCYTIEERSRNLYRVAQDGSQFAQIGQIEECRVEAMAWDRIGELWMFDAATTAFYTLDLGTATSTFKHAAPTCIRSDNGLIHQIADVDALDFDAFNSNLLWAVDRVTGGLDLLFTLDVVTGQVIGNICYPVTGVGLDIEDIGVDPLTGTMYAIANINGIDYLIVLDTLSGAGFIIGALLEAGVPVTDMEGFGFDVDGQLIGTTGECSDRPGSLYFINKGTGAVNWLTTIDMVNSDIESIACFNASIDLSMGNLPNSNGSSCPQCPDMRCTFNPLSNIVNCGASCPDGSRLEYRVNDGMWDEDEPIDNNQLPEMLFIRCHCDVDDSVVSDAVMVSRGDLVQETPCCESSVGSFGKRSNE